LEQVKSLYPNSPGPQADASGRIGIKAIHLADEGIWISLNKSDKVYAIKLDAPFHGAIAGLKIGDSAETLVKLLGAPSLKIAVPNRPESFTYRLVEDAVVNYGFDNLCTITTIVMFATYTNIPANSAFKPSMENEMPELAKRLNCSACHSISRKVVGPAWVDVSSRYKNATNFEYQGKEYPLEEGLLLKVSKGGSGHWSQMPMPAIDPKDQIQADIKELITFILGLAK
jgi:cytochrome c